MRRTFDARLSEASKGMNDCSFTYRDSLVIQLRRTRSTWVWVDIIDRWSRRALDRVFATKTIEQLVACEGWGAGSGQHAQSACWKYRYRVEAIKLFCSCFFVIIRIHFSSTAFSALLTRVYHNTVTISTYSEQKRRRMIVLLFFAPKMLFPSKHGI